MKYMEIDNLNKSNALFNRLHSLFPEQKLEIEAYSCKHTKDDKHIKHIGKPLRFYIRSLEISLPDFEFRSYTYHSFKKISYDFLKKEVTYMFFRIYKNIEDVNDMVDFFQKSTEQLITINKSEVFQIETLRTDLGQCKVFMIYNKRMKRIVLLKLTITIPQERGNESY